MCGFFGRYSGNGSVGDLHVFCSATNYLSHRGPDSGAWWSEGRFFLGHRRLSIIDIEHGQQPMGDSSSRFVIVFNGEIYNYPELREELQKEGRRFRTNSDTEVILEGYLHWGEDVCRRLNGMFAFAIADRKEGSLFVARDRFGEKPLFLREENGGVTFSSELGAFCCLSDYKPDVDLDALGSFLCLNYVPGNRTLVDGIGRLAPGTWRKYTPQGREEERYWSPPKTVSCPLSFEEAIDSIQSGIDEGVKGALRSDVPVTIFLSGGIDSSLISESAVRQGNIQHAYCLDFEEKSHSEWPKAHHVSQELGIELRRVPLSARSVEDFFSIVERLDDPLADSSALAVWSLAKETAKDYKVVLTGDGGDELFAGYLTYQATALHRLLSRNLPMSLRNTIKKFSAAIPVSSSKVSLSYKAHRFLRAINLASSEAHFTWNGTWLPDEALTFLSGDAKVPSNSARHFLSDSPNLQELQLADINDYLPNDILTKSDRATMAFGLEARSPFLYHPLVELALSLPDNYKLPAFGKPKHILRQVAHRKFGAGVSQAKKQGFSIPVHDWLREGARPIMEDLLSPYSLTELPFLNAEKILSTKNSHLSGAGQLGFELWGLMVLVAWHRARIQLRGFNQPSPELERVFL